MARQPRRLQRASRPLTSAGTQTGEASRATMKSQKTKRPTRLSRWLRVDFMIHKILVCRSFDEMAPFRSMVSPPGCNPMDKGPVSARQCMGCIKRAISQFLCIYQRFSGSVVLRQARGDRLTGFWQPQQPSKEDLCQKLYDKHNCFSSQKYAIIINNPS